MVDGLAVFGEEARGVVPHGASAAARATSSHSTLRPTTQNWQWPQEGVKVSTTFSPMRDFGHARPHGFDDAASLVTKDHRLRMNPDAAQIMNVAPADAGGHEFDAHFHFMRIVDRSHRADAGRRLRPVSSQTAASIFFFAIAALPSDHCHAAIDRQHGAGDEGGLVGGEKEGGARHFFRLGIAARADAGRPALSCRPLRHPPCRRHNCGSAAYR